MSWKFVFCMPALFTCLGIPDRETHGSDRAIEADSVLIRLIHEVEVPARAIGALVEVQVTEGTIVTKGQLLAQIDDTEPKLDYQRAQYELDIAAREAADDVAIRSAMKTRAYSQDHFQRLRRADLEQPRSVSQSELEKARLDADQAEFELERGKNELKIAQIRQRAKANALELARRNVDVHKIIAPMEGMVVKALRLPGEWVKPGEQIFRIVRTDRLRVEGFVQASDVVEGLRGKTVSVVPTLDGLPTRTFTGEIVFVSPEVDPINSQVRVAAEIDNPEGLLRPGLHAKMTISTE